MASSPFDAAAARGLRRYVRLVTAAVGPAVDTAAVHWDHPATACLVLTGRLRWFPGRDVALTWDGKHGWAMVLVTPATGALVALRYQGTDVLPVPQDVAAFSAGLFRDEFPGLPDPPPGRRAAHAREVARRLAAYAVPGRGRHLTGRGAAAPVHLYGVITSRRDPA
ncbi:DUF6292 family protein [Amycolatopsis magusensis]|uniref:DUF6292 family protein n=1 Tax=Amycolatopsis magusensis TaxID=882444 RepID=UPI0024A8C97E|nr:DUF6292 family protein [Amycolatopsis magusensis]MDI5978148.1 DUF6292 family protein [Amycolatopsis magusensis]